MRPAVVTAASFVLQRDRTGKEAKSSGHLVVDRKGGDSEKGGESSAKHIVKADGNGASGMNAQISPVCGRARERYFR
ncbi:hypothetical protein EFQ99_02810 [Rhizobium vallis]|uniref:Uncharacterized protein n=1 Tax=Rhizobium vallis TaxID=634290 RepID=A0A3S0SU55_9HYPH|nr:hypothetical protein EFQ99_02810 [Rhizobium vallis]